MYTANGYAELQIRLEQLSDEKYRRFNETLMPGTRCVYGVRLPQLRAMAKQIAAEDWRGFLAVAQDATHTELMLQALVIDYARCDHLEHWQYVAAYVPKLCNWALCDTFSGGLKRYRTHREQLWPRLTEYLASEHEFEVRFGVVMLMDHFICDEYVQRVLAAMDAVRHEGYYVKMAVAWTVAECAAKYRDLAVEYLRGDSLDVFTHNKAIQKARESYRVSDADKALLASLKR